MAVVVKMAIGSHTFRGIGVVEPLGGLGGFCRMCVLE